MFGCRLARIPGLIALVLAIAAPAANATQPPALAARDHVRAPGHTNKDRPHRPEPTKPGTQAPEKTSGKSGCANADTAASSAPGAAMAASVLCLVNEQRAAHRLPALHEDARLDRSAQSWTNTMIQTQTFSHGTNFTGRIEAVGYDWSTAGENIGTGYATPRQIVTAWMASPDHCRNILDPSFADAGTGVNARGVAPYGPATWTQDFGLSMEARAPSSNTGSMNGCPYAG